MTLCANTVKSYRLLLAVDVEGVGDEIVTLPIFARSDTFTDVNIHTLCNTQTYSNVLIYQLKLVLWHLVSCSKILIVRSDFAHSGHKQIIGSLILYFSPCAITLFDPLHLKRYFMKNE